MIRFAAMLALAAAAWAQQTPMERLKVEAEKARVAVQPDGVVDDIGPVIAAQRLAFRDWMESRLPEKRRTLAGEWETLGADMDAALGSAGLKAAKTEDFKFGYAGLRTHWFPELPDVLFVVASVSIPCGTDDTVYARIDSRRRGGRAFWKITRKRSSAIRWEGSNYRSRTRKAGGLLLTKRISTQCASTWMMTAYDVYRFGEGLPKQLLAEQHSTYMGEDRLEYVLEPERLWVELVDASVGIDIPFSRTQVHGYDLSGARARRIEPVALQPQDFAEEWMTRPWPEMRAMSDPATAEFHERLAADYFVRASISGSEGATDRTALLWLECSSTRSGRRASIRPWKPTCACATSAAIITGWKAPPIIYLRDATCQTSRELASGIRG